MSEIKAKTVGSLREFIKDLPDDMPIYIDDESGEDLHACLSVEHRKIEENFDYNYNAGSTRKVEALVFGVT